MLIDTDVLTVDWQIQQLTLLALFSLSSTTADITSFGRHYDKAGRALDSLLIDEEVCAKKLGNLFKLHR